MCRIGKSWVRQISMHDAMAPTTGGIPRWRRWWGSEGYPSGSWWRPNIGGMLGQRLWPWANIWNQCLLPRLRRPFIVRIVLHPRGLFFQQVAADYLLGIGRGQDKINRGGLWTYANCSVVFKKPCFNLLQGQQGRIQGTERAGSPKDKKGTRRREEFFVNKISNTPFLCI